MQQCSILSLDGQFFNNIGILKLALYKLPKVDAASSPAAWTTPADYRVSRYSEYFQPYKYTQFQY